jgi:hypothetical protein
VEVGWTYLLAGICVAQTTMTISLSLSPFLSSPTAGVHESGGWGEWG